ncbi:MAG: class I SAM-dependent methyltransferase [Spirochaetes bacterium]|nr:MAG: class I SAM-dependent methyltransferase [Spirochaetota bacterium]
MSRLDDVRKFLEHEGAHGVVIEPGYRFAQVRDRLLDVLNDYNPGVIVKAGLGGGDLLLEIARHGTGYLAVVEPSPALIARFLDTHRGDPALERINFIAGDFHDFPVDYYKADLLVCVDCMSIFDSSKCVDEFRRALQFDGIFFLGTVVLDNADVDGAYDDVIHSLFPLHNDYYLEDDLKTMMDLNEFRFLKGSVAEYPMSFDEFSAYLAGIFPGANVGRAREIMGEQAAVLAELYGFKDGAFREKYFLGCFMRNKPEQEKR